MVLLQRVYNLTLSSLYFVNFVNIHPLPLLSMKTLIRVD